MVVFGHSIIIYSSQWEIYTTNNSVPLLDGVKAIINIIQMPLFFSLAGYLFYYTVIKRSMVDILLKKLYRLGIPFLVFSYCYLLPIRKAINYAGYEKCSFTEIVFNKILFGEDNGHMWYLPVLFLCFIIAAALLKICFRFWGTTDIKSYCFLLFLSWGGYFSNFILNCKGYIQYVLLYLLYFSLGLILCVVKENRKNLLERWIFNGKMKIVLCIVTVISVAITLIMHSYFLVSMFSSIICVLTIYVLIPDKEVKLLSVLSENSFGIYLFHSPLVYITYTYFPNAPVPFVVALNLFCFGGISLVATMLIRKSKLRVVIGEK